jgi:hypothetical protein
VKAAIQRITTHTPANATITQTHHSTELLQGLHRETVLWWILSHHRTEGNERTDFLAKERYTNQTTQQHEHTLQFIKRNHLNTIKNETEADFERNSKNKIWIILLNSNKLFPDLPRKDTTT